MSDVIPTFGRREEYERGGHEGRDVVEGAWSRGAEERFQFRERHFDGIEIGTVGRQEPQPRADRLDGRPDLRLAMDGEVVEDDDVAGAERRHQDLLHVRQKTRVVDRPIEDGGRRQAIGPQRRDHRVGLPMAARGVVAQPNATRTATVAPQQIGRDATFINEDVVADVTKRQPGAPASAFSRDVGPPLLVGVNRFF